MLPMHATPAAWPQLCYMPMGLHGSGNDASISGGTVFPFAGGYSGGSGPPSLFPPLPTDAGGVFPPPGMQLFWSQPQLPMAMPMQWGLFPPDGHGVGGVGDGGATVAVPATCNGATPFGEAKTSPTTATRVGTSHVGSRSPPPIPRTHDRKQKFIVRRVLRGVAP